MKIESKLKLTGFKSTVYEKKLIKLALDTYGLYAHAIRMYQDNLVNNNIRRTKNEYNYIPSYTQVLEILYLFIQSNKHHFITPKYRDIKFLDVGSGEIPALCISLKHLFDNTKNSESRLYTYGLNKPIKGVEGDRSYNPYNNDAFEFNKYDEFDILYTYNIFKDAETNYKLLIHLMDKMKYNSVLIFCQASWNEDLGKLLDTKFQKLPDSLHIYHKI